MRSISSKRQSAASPCPRTGFTALFWGMCIALLLACGLSAASAQTAFAASKSISDNIMAQEKTAPAGFDATDTTNPYSVGTEKFLLCEQDELLLFQSNNMNDNGLSWNSMYNHYTAEGSMGIGGGFEDHGDWDETVAGDKAATTMDWVKAIAFDPTGSGHKDYVAYVGYKYESNKVYIWTYNTKTCAYSDIQSLVVDASWFDDAGIWQYNATNYFAITAGDYNGDGIDTVIVYNPVDGGDICLTEHLFNTGTNQFSQVGWSRNQLHQAYLNASKDGNKLCDSTSPYDKLGCDLTTGDFDGDGVDDLGVISYIQDIEWDDYSNVDLFRPMVAAVFGEKGKASNWCILTQGVCKTKYVSSDASTSDGVDTYQVMRSPSIDAGDTNGDGFDELVCAGYYASVEYDTADKTAEFNDSLKTSKLLIGEVAVTRSKIASNCCAVSSNPWTNKSMETNAGSDASKHGIPPKIAVTCVAINGQSAAEYVFIAGTLYEVLGGAANELYTPGLFSSKVDGTGWNSILPSAAQIDQRTIYSAVAGNFDENTQGREQIVFTIGLREHGLNNDYYFKIGILGGKSYNESNVAKDYYDRFNSGDGCNTDYIISNKGDDQKQMLNCIAVTIDRDDDGLLGRYSNKGWCYTDPSVAAVLQAAPFFEELDELGGYDDPCNTSYSIATSYEVGETSGNSVSFGVGFTGEIETAVADVELQAGYAMDWSESFERAVETTYTTTFSAGGYDQVIVQRTPVTVYHYDLWDNSAKKWVEDAYDVSVPGKPVYYQLSVAEYNAFVTAYNTYIGKDQLIAIVEADDGDMPANNEGNPSAYWNNWTWAGDTGASLSQSPLTLGYKSGNSASEWSTTSSYTHGIEWSHGFSFEMSVKTGFELAGNGGKAGGYVSLEYMSNSGSYTTEAEEKSASGQVQNLNSEALLAAGVPQNVIESYGFTWEFGTWQRKLSEITCKDKDGHNVPDMTPFFGYVVTNLKCPPAAPENLMAVNSESDSLSVVELSWDPADSEKAAGYNVFVQGEDGFEKLNGDPVTDCSFIVGDLKSNTEYTFVVTTAYKIEETDTEYSDSLWSEPASILTPRCEYTLTLSPSKGAVIQASSSSAAIENGGGVKEENVVYITASAKAGYTLVGLKLIKGDGTVIDQMSTDGTFNFIMRGNSEIVATAVRTVDSSQITLNTEGPGTAAGYVDGIAFNPKNATAMGEIVDLVATPDEGYVLKEWRITTGEDTNAVAANGSTEYSFGTFAPAHTITAVFVADNDPAILRSVAFSTSEGGTLELAYRGQTLTVTGNETIQVPVGTTIDVTAVPEGGYALREWTGNVADLSKKTLQTQITAMEDMAVGAVFYAPVRYVVEFAASDSDGGSVSATVNGEAIKSGALVVPSRDVVFTAQAAEGYRLAGWEITNDGAVETITFDAATDGLVTEDTRTVENINGNVEAIALFKEIEKYKFTADVTGDGTVVLDRNGETIENGGYVQYADKVTVVATPGEGYHLTSLALGETAIENGAEILATDDIAITGLFELNTYIYKQNVAGYGTVTATLGNGTELADGDTITHFDQITFTWTPEKDSQFISAAVNGTAIESGATVDVTGDVTAKIVFKMDLSKAKLTLAKATYDYTGKAVKPAVTVTVNGHKVAAANYTVKYANNVAVGTAKLTVTATKAGSCINSKSKTFAIKDNITANTNKLNAGLKCTTASGKFTMKWGQVSTADGYEIYATECLTETDTAPLVKTVKGSGTLTAGLTKVDGKAVSASKCYRGYVKAYRMVSGQKKYIGKSLMIHASGPYYSRTNAKQVTVTKTARTLKTGATAAVGAKTVKQDSGKSLLSTDHDNRIRYWSTNKKVATVSSGGTIKGVGAGTCSVYAMAQNGVKAKVSVTVK